MQFAQNPLSLGPDGRSGVRGSMSKASAHDYSEAVAISWDGVFATLGAGKLDAEIEFLAGDGFLLYREGWNQRCHMTGVLKNDVVLFGIPSRTCKPGRWWGGELAASQIPFFGGPNDIDLLSEAGELITSLVIDIPLFHSTYQALTGREATKLFQKRHTLTVSPVAQQRVRCYWDSVLARSAMGRDMRIGVADLLAPLLDAINLEGGHPHRTGANRGVLELVMREAERSGFQASAPELSMALGVSRRTIEYAFRKQWDISPQNYFSLRRFNLCKEVLESADPRSTTVTHVASANGFSELGRFATRYRQYFGELPSESLRKVPQAELTWLRPG